MKTVDVFYTGKKQALDLTMPWLSKKYHFKPDNIAVPMVAKDARRLIRENPVPFKAKLSERKLKELFSDGGLDGDGDGVAETIETPVDDQDAGKEEAVEKEEAIREEPGVPKYPSQMNKTELLNHAVDRFDTVLDIEDTKAVLRDKIARLEEAANDSTEA